MPELTEPTIQILKGPTFEYIPSIDRSAYLKIEVIESCDLVDDQVNREMVWHRYSYADAVSGPYDFLYTVPFGLAAVSGDPII